MEWISVKDRLPSKDMKNIVCLINENPILAMVHDATFCLKDGRVSFYWPQKQWIKDKYFGEITHWMPLPKKPTV